MNHLLNRNDDLSEQAAAHPSLNVIHVETSHHVMKRFQKLCFNCTPIVEQKQYNFSMRSSKALPNAKALTPGTQRLASMQSHQKLAQSFLYN